MTETVFFLLLLHGTKRRRPDEADVPHTLSQCVTPNCIRGAWPTGLLFERTCTVCSTRGFCYLPRPRGPARNLIFFRRIKPPPPPLLIIQHPPGTDSDGSNGRHSPVENPILLYIHGALLWILQAAGVAAGFCSRYAILNAVSVCLSVSVTPCDSFS